MSDELACALLEAAGIPPVLVQELTFHHVAQGESTLTVRTAALVESSDGLTGLRSTRTVWVPKDTVYKQLADEPVTINVSPSSLPAENIAAAVRAASSVVPDHILQFFAFEHLPAHLQEVSRPFCELAARLVETLPRNPERTVALRKLLEAKDAAVRALVARD